MRTGQSLGTIHALPFTQIIISVIYRQFLIRQYQLYFIFGESRGIDLQHYLGIDDTCHAQRMLRLLVFGRQKLNHALISGVLPDSMQ